MTDTMTQSIVAANRAIRDFFEVRDFSETRFLADLISSGGAFDFWNDPDEDLYNLDDGDPVPV